MKKLIIIRHAKSCWDTIANDFSRPISCKGALDANLVSAKLYDYLPKKSIVWSSSAKRATETAKIFCHTMDINLDCILYKDELYTFELQKLEKEIKKCSNDYDTLIVFGHNEALTTFVNKFGSKFYKKVPTSGVVIINFEEDDWSSITRGITEIKIFPKDLKR
ncbi:MAG: histidine phosphatase family protein [Flavobacteriaceae bacterium]|jgi:phosphohistidine phosphatase|nr:histidine phosphatase family protein [Flavobacteriaceae bacterium]